MDEWDETDDGEPDRSYNDPWWPSLGVVIFLVHAAAVCGGMVLHQLLK